MAATLMIYATAEGAPADDVGMALKLDDGRTVSAPCTTANGRDDAHVLQCPDNAGRQGAELQVSCDRHGAFGNRGLYLPPGCDPATGAINPETAPLGIAYFLLDDVRLKLLPEPAPGPDPGPEPPQPATDPPGIINEVYATGHFDLSTHDGCGEFTEECCKQLHERLSPAWGHIKKNPGQNQYAGHAVDALMLAAGEGCGIWDIIYDSVSPNAQPAYNYKGEPDLELWYYPVADAADHVFTVQTRSRSTSRKG